MMRVVSILALTVGAWGQRLIGGFVVGPLLERRPVLARAAALIPAAVVMAVIVALTVTSGGQLTVDARLAGVGVAGLLVWRRAPFIVVVVAAAITTALVRAV